MDNDDDNTCYLHDDNDCCPDYCPVFGAALALCSKPQTFKNETVDIKHSASYAFNLSMNRDKSKFIVRKSGFYAIGYYIEVCFAKEGDEDNMSAQIYVQRCDKDSKNPNPTASNDDWGYTDSSNALGIVNSLASMCHCKDDDKTSRYIWAVRSQYLNKGDSIQMQLVNKGDSVKARIQLAGFAAVRLMPCGCIPPGGLPEIDLKSKSLSSVLFGMPGVNIDLVPFQAILGGLLSGPIAAVLPALLKDSLPDVLQSYLGQETYEGEQGACLD
jgi:hypothetical protein